jgi:hypothetical protein
VTRGIGAIALILLTRSVTLDVANVRRATTAYVPGLVFDGCIATPRRWRWVLVAASPLDGCAPIRLIE